MAFKAPGEASAQPGLSFSLNSNINSQGADESCLARQRHRSSFFSLTDGRKGTVKILYSELLKLLIPFDFFTTSLTSIFQSSQAIKFLPGWAASTKVAHLSPSSAEASIPNKSLKETKLAFTRLNTIQTVLCFQLWCLTPKCKGFFRICERAEDIKGNESRLSCLIVSAIPRTMSIATNLNIRMELHGSIEATREKG